MKVLNQIENMLCDELEDIVKKNDLSPNSLDIIDTAVDVVKDIRTIKAMEQEYPEEGGYSQGYWGRMPYYMYDDNPNPGNSYAKGSSAPRDSRGRYYDNGYSRDTKSELEKLMHTAENDREREAIRNALDHMNR